MAELRYCPSCNAPIPLGSPRNLCPQCLLRGVLEDLSDDCRAPGNGSGSVTCGSVLDSIAATIGSVPRVLLRDTAPGEPPGPVIRPTDSDDADATIRYRIDGEIARGGMGAVLKGRDPDLGRDVALKVLREDHRDNPDLIRRFIEEAQIGGQLQHPGIVPIYELGTFTDRRPFFSMKLVKGQTLAELLNDRASPADGLPRFLTIYEAICQTVAYAHARGVIHRDLKPSNVMVGSFGEVQVMDWGLAKVLPRGGVVDDARAGKSEQRETVIATVRSGPDEPDLSHAGSVLGTPSYMAPEQARGEIDQVDERADVFALGSILCEILTGEPVFRGRSAGEIQRKAAVADTADALARLDQCGVEPELVALAKDCLARERDDRPRSAGSVAERVRAYLASVQEKLKAADRDRAVAEARAAEERKQRRLQVGLAASVIALMALGGGGYIVNQQQRAERIARTARGVDDALADAARLKGEAQAAPPGDLTKWDLALSAATRARDLVAQGDADASLQERVIAFLDQLEKEQASAAEKAARVQADRALLTQLDLIRGTRLDEGQEAGRAQPDIEYAAAFSKAGLDLDRTEPALAGQWLAARTEPSELASFLDDWSDVRRLTGRPAAEWRRLVAAARAADPDPWRDALRARVGDDDAGAVAEFRHLADQEKALDAQPAASLVLLARQLRWVANDTERAARVLRRAVLRHPGDYRAHSELGSVFYFYHQVRARPSSDDEEMLLHRAVAVALRPTSPVAHRDFGELLHYVGRQDQAIAEFREAVRLRPDWAQAHRMLGDLLAARGQDDLAIDEFRAAIRLDPNDPHVTSAFRGLVRGLQKQGKVVEAVTEFREAVRLRPDDVNAHRNLARVLEELGKRDEAIAVYRDAIMRNLDNPKIHTELAVMLRKAGKLDDAVAEILEAIRLKPDLPVSYIDLGFTLNQQGKVDDAVAAYRDCLRVDPGNWLARLNLGAMLARQGKQAQAIDVYREALRLAPYFRLNHMMRLNLGSALLAQGKLDEAVAAYRESARILGQPMIGQLLVETISLQGKLPQYVDELREAIRLKPDYAFAHYTLGLALQRENKLDQAVAEFREAIRLVPGFASEHDLRSALKAQGKLDDEITAVRNQVEQARKSYGTAHDLTASALAQLGALLVKNGKWSDAEPVLRECLAIREKNQLNAWTTFNTQSLLGGSLLGQGKHADAEPLILSGYEGLKARVGTGSSGSEQRLAEASERVVELYESWGKKDRAAEWRARIVPKTFAERQGFAFSYNERKRFAAAARLWAEALEADPKRVESRKDQHRYSGACFAALAASGQGQDMPPPDDAERAKFRAQALEWLRAELAAWAKVLDGGSAEAKATVLKTLHHWKVDTDLAAIRDPGPLANLPEPEQKSWRALWADVDALLKRAQSRTP